MVNRDLFGATAGGGRSVRIQVAQAALIEAQTGTI